MHLDRNDNACISCVIIHAQQKYQTRTYITLCIYYNNMLIILLKIYGRMKKKKLRVWGFGRSRSRCGVLFKRCNRKWHTRFTKGWRQLFNLFLIHSLSLAHSVYRVSLLVRFCIPICVYMYYFHYCYILFICWYYNILYASIFYFLFFHRINARL